MSPSTRAAAAVVSVSDGDGEECGETVASVGSEAATAFFCRADDHSSAIDTASAARSSTCHESEGLRLRFLLGLFSAMI